MPDSVQRIGSIGMATAEGRPPAYARLLPVASAGGPPSVPSLPKSADGSRRRETSAKFPVACPHNGVHWDEVAEIEVAVHDVWGGLVLLRRAMAPAQGDGPETFTLLTTEPGPDVAPIHNRQMVVLGRADWRAWLDLTRPESELLRPLPSGTLLVEHVR